jgi:hypothetical protein
MKANELRIGNYISPLGKGITIVEGFCTWDGLIQSSSFAERSIEDFEPIKITEEWLLKLGFECILDISYSFPKPYDNLELAYYGSINGFKKGWVINKLFGLSNGIKYVHELQNLYFALTGEELTVKL